MFSFPILFVLACLLFFTQSIATSISTSISLNISIYFFVSPSPSLTTSIRNKTDLWAKTEMTPMIQNLSTTVNPNYFTFVLKTKRIRIYYQIFLHKNEFKSFYIVFLNIIWKVFLRQLLKFIIFLCGIFNTVSVRRLIGSLWANAKVINLTRWFN